MRKTEHHTIEGNRKTKNSIKRLFFCLLAIFLQIAFFLSIVKRLNPLMLSLGNQLLFFFLL